MSNLTVEENKGKKKIKTIKKIFLYYLQVNMITENIINENTKLLKTQAPKKAQYH